MNRKYADQLQHKEGTFVKHVQFISHSQKKLILVNRTGRTYSHWYVLYGNSLDDEFHMGLVWVRYPIATRAVTKKFALARFNRMIKDIDHVNFIKLSKNYL